MTRKEKLCIVFQPLMTHLLVQSSASHQHFCCVRYTNQTLYKFFIFFYLFLFQVCLLKRNPKKGARRISWLNERYLTGWLNTPSHAVSWLAGETRASNWGLESNQKKSCPFTEGDEQIRRERETRMKTVVLAYACNSGAGREKLTRTELWEDKQTSTHTPDVGIHASMHTVQQVLTQQMWTGTVA